MTGVVIIYVGVVPLYSRYVETFYLRAQNSPDLTDKSLGLVARNL